MTKKLSLFFLMGAALTVSFGSDQGRLAGGLPSLAGRGFRHADSPQTLNAPAGMPLYFVENRGQAADAVKYVLGTQREGVFFTSKEIIFQAVAALTGETREGVPGPEAERSKGEAFKETLKVRLLGARRDVKV